jgi:hypothetical protein
LKKLDKDGDGTLSREELRPEGGPRPDGAREERDGDDRPARGEFRRPRVGERPPRDGEDRPAREEIRRPREGDRLLRPRDRDEEAPVRGRRPQRDA